MGAWADISAGKDGVVGSIEGLATEIMSDPESKGFNLGDAPTQRLQSAKSVVRRKILTSDLAEEVDRYDGPESMLDALASNAKLEDMVYEAIAYAFLHVYTDGNRVQSGGLYEQQGEDFEADLEEQVEALSQTVPYVLDWKSESGDAIGGGLTNSYDRYN